MPREEDRHAAIFPGHSQSLAVQAATVVPAPTALFSFSSLSVAPDPARIASVVHLGGVNLDEGRRFAPINAGDKLAEARGLAPAFCN